MEDDLGWRPTAANLSTVQRYMGRMAVGDRKPYMRGLSKRIRKIQAKKAIQMARAEKLRKKGKRKSSMPPPIARHRQLVEA